MVGVPRGEFFTTDYTDCTDFLFFSREFALFAVDFSSTMRNPKEPGQYGSVKRRPDLRGLTELLRDSVSLNMAYR